MGKCFSLPIKSPGTKPPTKSPRTAAVETTLRKHVESFVDVGPSLGVMNLGWGATRASLGVPGITTFGAAGRTRSKMEQVANKKFK